MSSVDVIVPCYNYGRYLRECVSSALGQPGVTVRVLVIDDCSSDDTPQVGAALAAEDSRVEFRRHPINRGHIATYNEGLEWVAGDYCMILSADDVLTPGALTRAATVLDANPEVVLTHGMTIRTPNPASCLEPLIETGRVTIQTGPEFLRQRCEWAGGYVETPTVVARASTQRAVGGYHPELTHSADLEQWLRFAHRGSIAHIQTHQAYYRTHGQNMSEEYRGVANLRQVLHAFEAFMGRHGRELAQESELRRLAVRGILWQACTEAGAALDRGDRELFQQYTRFAQQVSPLSTLRPCWVGLYCQRYVGNRFGAWVRRTLLQRPQWLKSARG